MSDATRSDPDAARAARTDPDATRAARSLGWLVVQRLLDAVAGALFVLLVPRSLGPAEFGKWALVTAIALWFALVSSMSSTQVAVRFLPALSAPAQRMELERLVGRLLALRLAGAALGAVACFALTLFAIPGIDVVAIGAVSGSVFLRSVAKLLFAFLLGLGNAARWGVGEALRRWMAVACIVPGVLWAGLTGACWGLLVGELVVAALGLVWVRELVVLRHVRLTPRELHPYLRFGASFAAGTVLLALSQRSGELLLRLGDADYAEIGVFGVAYRAFLGGIFTLWHLSMAFAPELGTMAAAGDRAALARWVERLMTAGAVLGMALLQATLLVGADLVPIVLGARFAGTTPHLVPLAAAIVAMALGTVCRIEAVVLDRWDVTLGGALVHLTAFWASGWLLVARLGPLGASFAALLAAAAYGGFMALAMRRRVDHRFERWARAIALGLPFLAFAWLRGGLVANALLCAAALVGYAALLLRLGVVNRQELASLRAILRRRDVRVETVSTAE